MKRFEERKEDFENATRRLKEALQEQETDLNVDGVLHRYEFTFELSWKTLKDFLEYLGVTLNTGSPREVIKVAFENKLIDDGEAWIKMMLARNALSHLYEEETSREIYSEIKNKYIFEFEKLIDVFNK